MAYYAGGYYAGGNYYAGGIFGNLFRGIKGVVGGAIGGLIKGGPIGGIVGAVGGAGRAISQNIQQETLEAGDAGSALTPAIRAKHAAAVARGGAGGGAPIHPSLATPGGMAMIGPPVGAGMMGPMLKGYHVNKSTYVSRGGGTSRWPAGLAIHPAHTELVRNRRMNWGNSRALVRAERRIASFVHHATKYIRWMHPHRGGRAVPKFPKRKRRR